MKDKREDDGLGLVEVIVSLIIVAILFLALGGLLIKAVSATAANGTKSTADQFAAQRMDQARTVSSQGFCSNLKGIVTAVSHEVDGRGVPLTITGTVAAGTCDQTAGSEHASPRLARVTITVTTTAVGYTNPVATTTSDIYVKFK